MSNYRKRLKVTTFKGLYLLCCAEFRRWSGKIKTSALHSSESPAASPPAPPRTRSDPAAALNPESAPDFCGEPALHPSVTGTKKSQFPNQTTVILHLLAFKSKRSQSASGVRSPLSLKLSLQPYSEDFSVRQS